MLLLAYITYITPPHILSLTHTHLNPPLPSTHTHTHTHARARARTHTHVGDVVIIKIVWWWCTITRCLLFVVMEIMLKYVRVLLRKSFNVFSLIVRRLWWIGSSQVKVLTLTLTWLDFSTRFARNRCTPLPERVWSRPRYEWCIGHTLFTSNAICWSVRAWPFSYRLLKLSPLSVGAEWMVVKSIRM
jgi:hypothetical protein